MSSQPQAGDSKTILMVSPEHFDILYAINPHMKTASGEINKVNRPLALQQWQNLKETFEHLGAEVKVIKGVSDYPDMVFCANQCIPFVDRDGNRSAIMGKMRHPERRGEVEYFREYLQSQAYKIFETPDEVSAFEGMGDALKVFDKNLILGGYGPRTDKKIYSELAKKYAFEVLPLELVHPDFYHLDTCVVVLSSNAVAFVPQALGDGGEGLRQFFPVCIEITEHEAKNNFAANAFSLDQKHIILQKGSAQFCEALRKNGFNPVEVDTGEYIKAGGSVFCMKMMLP